MPWKVVKRKDFPYQRDIDNHDTYQRCFKPDDSMIPRQSFIFSTNNKHKSESHEGFHIWQSCSSKRPTFDHIEITEYHDGKYGIDSNYIGEHQDNNLYGNFDLINLIDDAKLKGKGFTSSDGDPCTHVKLSIHGLDAREVKKVFMTLVARVNRINPNLIVEPNGLMNLVEGISLPSVAVKDTARALFFGKILKKDSDINEDQKTPFQIESLVSRITSFSTGIPEPCISRQLHNDSHVQEKVKTKNKQTLQV